MTVPITPPIRPQLFCSLSSNGDAVNADPTQPSEIVEFPRTGSFVGQFNVDAGQGGAFGIGIAMAGPDIARLAVVDDNANHVIVIDQKPAPLTTARFARSRVIVTDTNRKSSGPAPQNRLSNRIE